MKKELILSSLLMVAPISNINSLEISELIELSIESRKHLVNAEFVSSEVMEFKDYYIRGKKVSFEGRVTLKFIKAENYEYDGEGELDYEMIIEVSSTDGKYKSSYDSFYFGKLLSEGETFSHYKIFDCDTTSICSVETKFQADALVQIIGNKEILTIENPNLLFFTGHDIKKMVFHKTK